MLKGYALLILSILLEVFSTQMMKASLGFTKILPTIIFAVGMCGCFYTFSKSLLIIPLGVAYAIWAGVGTALTAIIAVCFWKESFSWQLGAGTFLIIVGCILINLRK